MTFTNSGKKVGQIAKLFRDTNLKITFRTCNTTENVLIPTSQTDKYKQSGICHTTYLNCLLKCTGQTGRAFGTRYKEHLLAIQTITVILDMLITYSILATHMEPQQVLLTSQKKGEKKLLNNAREMSYLISKRNIYVDNHNPIPETLHKVLTR
jgi:serine kinase of HPr protein (carbohydrate metabolism regulator)